VAGGARSLWKRGRRALRGRCGANWSGKRLFPWMPDSQLEIPCAGVFLSRECAPWYLVEVWAPPTSIAP